MSERFFGKRILPFIETFSFGFQQHYYGKVKNKTAQKGQDKRPQVNSPRDPSSPDQNSEAR